jgi:hypothetical protein
MAGFTDVLACVTDDRGLFSLSVCNKAVVPRRLYAGCWWRHGVVLRSRISAQGNACADAVCILKPWPSRTVIESQFLPSFGCVEAALRIVKNTYNK